MPTSSHKKPPSLREVAFAEQMTEGVNSLSLAYARQLPRRGSLWRTCCAFVGELTHCRFLTGVFFAVLQFVPNLKKDWVLSQVIISSALVFLSSAFPVFKSTLIFMRYIWAAELILFCILAFLLLRKKKEK